MSANCYSLLTGVATFPTSIAIKNVYTSISFVDNDTNFMEVTYNLSIPCHGIIVVLI